MKILTSPVKYVAKRINDCYWWVRYRTINKMHVVKTSLRPGYHDKDEIMLFACFTLLQSYVENELSVFYDFNVKIPEPSRNRKKDGLGFLELQIQKYHSKLKELEELDREPDLDEMSQLDSWKRYEIIKDLYLWWTEKRPTRGDPGDVTGHNQMFEALSKKYGTKKVMGIYLNDDETTVSAQFGYEMETLRKLGEDALYVEEEWNDEDQVMLEQLISVRNSLWT